MNYKILRGNFNMLFIGGNFFAFVIKNIILTVHSLPGCTGNNQRIFAIYFYAGKNTWNYLFFFSVYQTAQNYIPFHSFFSNQKFALTAKIYVFITLACNLRKIFID